MMNSEILKKIIAEWLEDKVFPSLAKRDTPDIALERMSEIIAIAGPRRAGKTCYIILHLNQAKLKQHCNVAS